MKDIAKGVAILVSTVVLLLGALELLARSFAPCTHGFEVHALEHCEPQPSKLHASDAVNQNGWRGAILPRWESFFYLESGAWRIRPCRSATLEACSGTTRVAFRSNSHGFRGPPLDMHQNRRRILFLGDSVTFGLADNEQETWVHLLGEALRKTDSSIEVVNGGVPSNGFREYAAIVDEQLVATKADLVVLGVVLNDHRSCCSVRMALPPRLLSQSTAATHFFEQLSILLARRDRDVQLLSPPTNILQLWTREVLQYVDKLNQSPHSREFADQLKRQLWYIGFAWSESAWRDAGEHIASIQQYAERRGARLLLLLFPLRSQVEAAQPDTFPQDALAELAVRHGLSLLDLLPGMRSARQSGRDELFIDQVHLSKDGNAVTAELLLPFLRSQL